MNAIIVTVHRQLGTVRHRQLGTASARSIAGIYDQARCPVVFGRGRSRRSRVRVALSRVDPISGLDRNGIRPFATLKVTTAICGETFYKSAPDLRIRREKPARAPYERVMSAFTVPVVAPRGETSKAPRPTSAKDIGNPEMEGHGHCPIDGPKTAECFLEPLVRVNVNNGIGRRSSRLLSMILSAAAELRTDQLVKKPEDVGIIEDLVIDAISAGLGKSLGRVLNSLRSKPAAALVDLGVGLLDVESADKTKEADSGVVDHVVKAVTTSSKKGLKVIAQEQDKDELSQDKKVATSYLDQLKDSATFAVDQLSEVTPGMLGDADRILLYHSLGPAAGVTPSEIKQALSDGMKRFASSPVSKIGRSPVERHLEKPPSGSSLPDALKHQQEQIAEKKVDNVNDVRATKLVMRHYTNGQPPQLWYYKRDFDGGVTNAPGGDALLDTENEYPEFAAKDAHYVPYQEVETEFVEMAIAANVAAWNRRYETEYVSVPDPMKTSANRTYPDADPAPYHPPASMPRHYK